jgi:hypothetical protein
MALPRAKRVARAFTASALLVAVAALTGMTAQARTTGHAAASAVTSRETGITFTSHTVVVPKATVSANLAGVSASGTFKFRHAAGPLASLHKGSVMLLEGSDAMEVTSVSHQGGQLLVHTTPASLPQLIKTGTISVSGTPDFHSAFVGPTVTSPSSKSANVLERPGYPYLGRAPQAGARTAAGFTFSVQGSAGAFGYSLSFTPSANRLDVAGVICFQWGSICSNGPSNGLSLEANISGYIDVGADKASISVNGGRITHSSITVDDLHAHLKITYTGARGTGPDSGGDPPVFHLPVGIDYTIPGEIPIYIKVQTALLVKLGLSSKNTVLRGGVEYDSAGATDTVTQSGSSVSGSGSGSNPTGQILDASNGGTGASTALGAGGVVLAVQFPKIGLGLGVRALNGIGYLDMVTSLGQTAAGAIAGGGCKFDFDWSEGGGFELQAGPFGLATPRKILIPSGQQYARTFNAPGC